MAENLIIQGRRLNELDLQSIRQWLGEHPDWSRWHLSRELATRWDWRNRAGQLKDMAARMLLGKLEQRGLIGLPPRRQVHTNRMRCRYQRGTEPEWDQRRIDCDLKQLEGLTVKEVSTQPGERAWVRAALSRFHYLGFGGAVGENLQYTWSGTPRGAHWLVWCLGRRPGSVRTGIGSSAGRRNSGKRTWPCWPTTRVL